MGSSLKQKEAVAKFNRETKRLTTEKFIEKAKIKHGDKFDYSVTEYVNATTKLKIKCPVHGVHEMLPHHHTGGHGCPECGRKAINRDRKLTQDEFIQRVSTIEGLSFEKTVYRTKRHLVIVTCQIHGDYKTKAEVLLKGCGCPKCKCSNGENQIADYLKSRNIYFFQQMTFPGCKLERDLYFDFYLPSLNACIEYDGEQHFKPIAYWGGEAMFRRIQTVDNIKEKYCLENDIKLLRIKYDENIIDKLDNFILSRN